MPNRIVYSLIILCLIATSSLQAQLLSPTSTPGKADKDYGFTIKENKEERETLWQLFKYDAKNILGGVGYAYTRPLSWQKDDFIILGATVAGTAALYTFDNESSRYFRDQVDDVPQVIRDYGFYYGSPQNNYMAMGAVYLTGLVIRSEKVRRVGVLLAASATAGGILQQAAKIGVGRARPNHIADRDRFKPFDLDAGAGFHSFPSGHTVLSITNAHIIAKLFESPWIKAGVYVIGAIPPISRVWEGAHWLTDVALSTVMSIAIVEAIDKFLDSKYETKLTKGPREKSLSWDLRLGPGQLGVAVTF